MSNALSNFNYWCVLALLMLNSCVQYKNIPYLQETTASEYKINPPTTEYKVRKADLLHIDLKTFETSTKEFFEGNQGGNSGGSSGTGNPQLFFRDFLVDQEGMIDLPIIGKLAVLGKTTDQITLELEGKLKTYMKLTKVTVRLSNYRITMLGEVNQTGVQYIYERNYTLLQALSNAGDLTEFANRKKVKLIRQDGQKVKSIWIDMTDPNLLSSEYFYLQPDDLIYIEPLKAKTLRSNIQNASIFVSVASIATAFISLLTR